MKRKVEEVQRHSSTRLLGQCTVHSSQYTVHSAQYTVYCAHITIIISTNIVYTTTNPNSYTSVVSAILSRSGLWMLQSLRDSSSYRVIVMSEAMLLLTDQLSPLGHAALTDTQNALQNVWLPPDFRHSQLRLRL